ncbi:integrase [Mycolicibacterium moriokaense]|uniref:integrase n=1 Tax=Mycolicibacterium moriokaense TaxID=39691 RepID=UPI000D76DE8A|nr:integrase [Mycolicibacterium moriokaense]
MAASVVRHPHAPNTRRAYDSDWTRFVGWCSDHGHRPLPAAPSVVAGYLRDAAQARNADGEPLYAAATVRRWAASIADRHGMSDYSSPTTNSAVRQALSAITKGGPTTTARSSRPAAPLLTADITAMIAAARKGTIGWATEVLERRDSALVLMGYAGALGRRDLVAMLCGDLTSHPHDGLQVAVRRPNGTGAVELPPAESHYACPSCAVLRWMQVVAAFDSGGRAAVIRLIKAAGPFEEHICGAPLPRTRARSPFFRSIRKNGNLSPTPLSGASIHLAVRRRARMAGYDDDFVAGLGAQSLRAGFIAQALRNKADIASILRQTGHVSQAALQRYAPAEPGDGNAVTGLGL